MTGGTEFSEAPKISEAKEVQAESQDLAQARENLNRSTFDAPAEIQARAELMPKASENLEKEAKAAVDAVTAVAELKPAEISLSQVEGVSEGAITIESAEVPADGGPEVAEADQRPETEDRTAAAEGEMDPDPVDGESSETNPEAPAEADNLDGEAPSPPLDGTDPIPPSDPTSAVAAVSGTRSQNEMDFSQEMQGAKPSEVRGYEDPQGNESYAFTGDGETGAQEVVERFTTNQGAVKDPNTIREQVQQSLETPASDLDVAPELSAEGRNLDPAVISTAQSIAEDGPIDGDQADGSTAKVLGSVPSQGSGLPIDDDDGGDNGDTDNGDDPVDTPPQPPATDTSTGVSPSLPGMDGTGRDNSAEVQAEWTESMQDIQTTGVPVDVNDLVQSVLRDAYLENAKDLYFYADKVKYFNECKKQVREYMNDLREHTSDLPGDEQLTIPIITPDVGEDGSQVDVKQDLALSVEAARAFLALEPEEIGGESDRSSTERTSSGNSFDDVLASGLSKVANAAMAAGELAVPYIPGGSVISAALDGMGNFRDSIADREPQTSGTEIGEDINSLDRNELENMLTKYLNMIRDLYLEIKSLGEEIPELRNEIQEKKIELDKVSDIIAAHESWINTFQDNIMIMDQELETWVEGGPDGELREITFKEVDFDPKTGNEIVNEVTQLMSKEEAMKYRQEFLKNISFIRNKIGGHKETYQNLSTDIESIEAEIKEIIKLIEEKSSLIEEYSKQANILKSRYEEIKDQ